MATIATGLAIYDQMSNVLNNITNAMNLTVAAMTNMENAADRSFDNKALEAARNSVYGASAAYAEMANAIEKVAMEQEKLKPPEMPQWDTFESIDVFQSSGMERYMQEIESANQMLNELQRSQQQITNADMKFLPPQAITDINNLEQRVMGLRGLLQQAELDKQKLGKNAPAEAFNDVNSAIENIRNQLYEAIQAQNTMNTAMKAGDLSGVNAAYQKLSRQVEQTEHGIRNSINAQEKFNEKIKKGEDYAGGLLKTITGFAAAYLGINATKGFLTESWVAASGKTGAEQRLQSIMSNIDGMTQDGIDMLKQYAQELEKTLKVGADVGIMGMSQLGEYVYDPNNIKALTKSMYNLATETYGVGFSADNLLQTSNLIGKVMMGDINALSRNGFKIDAIFDEAEQKMLKFGTESEKTALVIQMIEENLDGLAEAMAQTPEGKLHGMTLAFDGIKEKIGFGLIPTIDTFYDVIMDNMPMIEGIFTNVFSVIFDLLDKLIVMVAEVAKFFVDNWSWIEPVIWGIVSALGAYLIMTRGVAFALRVAAIAQALFNAIMNMNPFILVATLVIGLIVALVRLWQTNDKFAAGLMRAWNAILNFFDQVPIFFTRVGNGIVNAFQWMKVKSLEILETMINTVIDDINFLIEKLNKIPGVSLDVISHVELSSKAALEAEAIRQAGEDAIRQMEDKAAKKAAEREQKVLDFLENRAAKRAAEEEEREGRFAAPKVAGAGSLPEGMWNIPDEISRVDEVGKIKDKVDISSEDLKMMRELAEMKNIQNFVTLTPTVSVQTGDINTGDDIDTIIAQITDRLETQIASSAQGVYA